MKIRRLLAGAAVVCAALSTPPAAHAEPLPAAAEPQPAATGSWSGFSLPLMAPDAALYGIEAESPDSVWAVGRQGMFCVHFMESCLAYGPGFPAVQRWNGSSWQAPALLNSEGVYGVWDVASGSDGTWIRGTAHPASGPRVPYIARFDGSVFRRVDPPAPEVRRLWAGPAGTWAATSTGLVHRSGDSWVTTSLPSGMSAVDLRALSATDAWAVGVKDGAPALAHWDGASWQEAPAPTGIPAGETPVAVRPVAADDIWVTAQKSLAHWDGTAWTVFSGPAGTARLGDTAVDGEGGVWVAVAEKQPVVLEEYVSVFHFTAGGGWERSSAHFRSDVSLTRAPGTDRFWASGNHAFSESTLDYPYLPSISAYK